MTVTIVSNVLRMPMAAIAFSSDWSVSESSTLANVWACYKVKHNHSTCYQCCISTCSKMITDTMSPCLYYGNHFRRHHTICYQCCTSTCSKITSDTVFLSLLWESIQMISHTIWKKMVCYLSAEFLLFLQNQIPGFLKGFGVKFKVLFHLMIIACACSMNVC